MAVTKAVLVNDGGAPARIINFEASEAITAGSAIEVLSTGKVKMADTDGVRCAGFAMVDAASGDLCSVITGSGVVLMANVDGDSVDVDVGDFLEVGENGTLIKQASMADKTTVAIALEANTAAPASGSLFKILVK
tara:strand:- start:1036 stop:1440 length:405 start_codon:yes stop_codon:yes gene_type:complete